MSCRTGGVSEPPFSSLNMGFHTGDDADAVRENRRRYFEALGLSASRLVSGNQVHGTYIYKVTEKDAGRGALTMETAIPACDGFMTDEKNIPITMNYADCTPLFFYDPVKRAIALSHGGWRGTAGNIAALTVAKMEKNYGSKRKDILCAIGPAIGLECFEVGEEVVEEFYKLFNEKEISRLSVKKPMESTFSICTMRTAAFSKRRASLLTISKTAGSAPTVTMISSTRIGNPAENRPSHGGDGACLIGER